MMKESDKSIQHLFAGTMGGMAATLGLYPLELVKTRMQVTDRSSRAYKSVFTTFRTVLSHEGFLGLYRGITPALVAASGSWGGYFYLYELSKKRRLEYRQRDGAQSPYENSSGARIDTGIYKNNTLDIILSGLEAGTAMVLVFNPVWVVRTRMALQGAENTRKYSSMADAFSTIWKEEGIRGLYKGLFPALLLTTHGSIQFAVYEAMKSSALSLNTSNIPYASSSDAGNVTSIQTPSQQTLSPWMSMLLGASSKIVAATVTYPYQVVKSRLQQRPTISPIEKLSTKADHIIASEGYHGTWDCVRAIFRKEGIHGFFRGVVPNCVKVAPGAAITFVVYEECMKLKF